MGPFQPMYPSGSLQHSMAVPHQQAGLNEGFAGEACYYNYTEPEGTLQQQQQVEEYGGTPHNNFSMSQEVQVCFSSDADLALLCCMWSTWGAMRSGASPRGLTEHSCAPGGSVNSQQCNHCHVPAPNGSLHQRQLCWMDAQQPCCYEVQLCLGRREPWAACQYCS